MKRRDWKTKKSKKGIYGKIFKRRRIFFLRELSLRKHSIFLKKDLTPSFYIYRQLLNNLELKSDFFSKIIFSSNTNYNFYFLFPNFFFKKKIFNYTGLFKDLIKNNELNYYFVKKKNDFNNLLPYGNNVVLFNLDNKDVDFKFLNNEDYMKLLTFKYINSLDNPNNEFNFFLNYNLYTLNLIEIYKIIVLVYLYKIL